MSTGNTIRTSFTDSTIRVYQAYRREIALPALSAQTFVEPFSMSRMTWIKPSFFWMMHRSGWGTKAGQEFVLAIDIARDGFDWALAHAALSAFTPDVHGNHETWKRQLAERPNRIQWDPERDAALDKLDHRAIQIGLKDEAVERYVGEWIRRIGDVTPMAHEIHRHSERGELDEAQSLAPAERPYPADSGGYPGIGLAGPNASA